MTLVDELKIIEKNEGIKPEYSLYQKYLVIKKHFQDREKLIVLIFPLYTLHDQNHSEAIINILSSFDHSKLLKKNPLNKYEIFLLISAAYMHDIGMIIIKKEDKFKNGKININNIRDNHNIRSCEYVLSHKFELKLDNLEASNLALICKGHRKENLYDNPEYNPIPSSSDPNVIIRINLLAALLRIADELDISFDRVQNKMKEFLKTFKTFDSITNLHWYKHYYTINYTTSFIKRPTELRQLFLNVVFHIPGNEYKNSFIIPFVLHPIQKELIYLQQIFNRYGFSIRIEEKPDVRIDPTLEKIPTKINDDILNFLLKQKDINILIVDDENISRKDFLCIISEMGYNSDMADNCKTAYEKIKNKDYHLILLDLQMPDMNNRKSDNAGLFLLKEIKRLEKNNIVVIISAMEQSSLISECFRNGAYDFIIKDESTLSEIKLKIKQALRMNFYLLNDKRYD